MYDQVKWNEILRDAYHDFCIPSYKMENESGSVELLRKNIPYIKLCLWNICFKEDMSINWTWTDDRFAILYLLKGHLRMKIGTTEFILNEKEGKLLIIPANLSTILEFEASTKYSIISCKVAPEYIHGADLIFIEDTLYCHNNDEHYIYSCHSNYSSEVDKIITELEKALYPMREIKISKEIDWDIYIKFFRSNNLHISSKILELIILMLRPSPAISPANLENIEESKIKEAREILLGNLQAAPTISQLAQKVYLNEKKLKLGFKKMFNHTINQYLSEQRLLKAQQLLLSTNKSIDEIALECGYNYTSYMIKVFRKKLGLTPGQYRKKEQEKE
jgi:AraC-like DNA-binding protein/mannose-6-phosphate isomerase-like protein (cupin superfamily)